MFPNINKYITAVQQWPVDEQFVVFHIFPNLTSGATYAILPERSVKDHLSELLASPLVQVVELQTSLGKKYLISTTVKKILPILERFGTTAGLDNLPGKVEKHFEETRSKNTKALKAWLDRVKKLQKNAQQDYVFAINSDNQVFTATRENGETIPAYQFGHNALQDFLSKHNSFIVIDGKKYSSIPNGSSVKVETTKDNHAIEVIICVGK